jgi:hypothetical protein
MSVSSMIRPKNFVSVAFGNFISSYAIVEVML